MENQIIESPQVLPVYDYYEITNELVKVGNNHSGESFYQPSEHPELPARLSDIHISGEPGILDFTRKYGLLGYAETYSKTLPGKQKTKFINSPDMWGDPVSWVMGHSNTVHKVFCLMDLLEMENEKTIKEFIRSWEQESSGQYKGNGIIYYSGISTMFYRTFLKPVPAISEGRKIVRSIIQSNVTPYLSETYVPIGKNENGTERSYKSETLLPLVYRHIGDLLIGLTAYYKCNYRNCSKRWPHATTRRGHKSQYCPPDVGKESRCSRNERYHRRKEKTQ